jgi:putative oxidoreductase
MISLLNLLARVLIVGIFLMSALGNKIPQFNAVAGYMAAEGVPLPHVMLAGAICFLIAGSVSIVLGYRTSLGAGMLLTFLILATYFFHDFWNFTGQERQLQMIQFLKNVSLMGTMLLLMTHGPGRLSLDGRAPRSAG